VAKDKAKDGEHILHEEIVFKQEISRVIQDEKNRAIRNILFTVENFIDKGSKPEIRIRKAVLDNINEFYRKICMILDKIV
jgi:hypothetical protein